MSAISPELQEALALMHQLQHQERLLRTFLFNPAPMTVAEVHKNCWIIKVQMQALSDWMQQQQMIDS